MEFVVSLVLLVFCDMFVLDLKFCLRPVYGHIALFLVSYCCWFSSWSYLLCFESIGIWLGKEEFNAA